MNKSAFYKILQVVFGIITALCMLFLSLIISFRIEHFSIFIIALFILAITTIYFMLVRKYALFVTGMIIGIFIFFGAIFILFQDRGFH
ncbi:hypothetical protein KAOT1_10671 [Kordia algicida OT-1]|uniref:Uncharacterized protein n=1 Tax=Kordia algicida OT-1 TaxID=391587 RepID=A9E2E7_9FLAO|nr:hypothetical protein KAOT1_10671 [Kordia algicida OT-1]